MYNASLVPFSPVRQWILDVIPAIGNANSLRFIKQKYLAEELTVAEVAQALVASTHLVTANAETIKLFEVGKPRHEQVALAVKTMAI